MQNIRLKDKVFIYFCGMPGSGKTFVARQLSDALGLAHIDSDKLRYELFEQPKHDKTEQRVIAHLMNYMTDQFLRAGVGAVYDISSNRLAQRQTLKKLAQTHKTKELLLWLQIDRDTALQRVESRDRRKSDDKYAIQMTENQFDNYIKIMQNPQDENYLVLSGKHSFKSQKATILRRLDDMGLVKESDISIAKPEMINLVSRAQARAGRIDLSRRNVIIR